MEKIRLFQKPFTQVRKQKRYYIVTFNASETAQMLITQDLEGFKNVLTSESLTFDATQFKKCIYFDTENK